jgi:hypothetical protein
MFLLSLFAGSVKPALDLDLPLFERHETGGLRQ